MIEMGMARRMVLRGLLVTPAIAAVAWVLGGSRAGLSATLGVALALGNLWLAARLIGGVAENNPQMLLPVGLATFVLGLVVLTGAALVIRDLSFLSFPVAGLSLVATHLGLVLWEATTAYARADRTRQSDSERRSAEARS